MTDEAALASLAVATNSYMDEYITDDKEKLMPAFSVHKGIAYSVIPAVRHVRKLVGRGRDKHEVSEKESQMVAITSDWRWLPYEEDVLSLDRLYPHKAPYIPEPPFKWHQDDAIAYIKERKVSRDTQDLYEELVDVWKEYAEFDRDIYYKLMALYVLQTYVYTIWNATGYVHFNGTAGSGKSRCLQIIEAIGYNGRAAMNISPSAMFRTINGNPGVLCIDETEAFKNEKDAEVYKLLLGGYDSHGQAIINDKIGDTYRPTAYITYCPKAIASIQILDSTLGSRTLIVPMVPALDPPAELPENGDWRYLRNDLHVWALQQAPAIERTSKAWDTRARHEHARSLINRSWQIARPYIVLASTFDRDLTDELIAFFAEYYGVMRALMQDADNVALVMKCLPLVLKHKPPIEEHWYSLQQIHDVVLAHLEEDQHDYYRTKHTNNAMTALRVGEKGDIGGKVVYRLTEAKIREELARRQIAVYREDEAWLRGEATYLNDPDPVQEALTDFKGWG